MADGALELVDLHLESARDPTVVSRPLHPWLSRLPRLARLLGELPDAGPDHATPGGPGGVLATIRAGQLFSVALDWRVLRDLDEDYAVYLKLLDGDGRAVAQDDERPQRGVTQMTLWHVGDVVPDGYGVRLPEGVGPARLTATIGVYRRADLRHLSWRGPGAEPDQLAIGSVKVPPPQPVGALGRAVEGTFGGSIELLGLRADPGLAHPRAGEALRIEPRWRVLRAPGHDYTVFVHLVDAAGRVVATGDAQPLRGRYPTSLWEPGEVIDDAYTVQIPAGATGRLGVVGGLYDPTSGARLGLAAGGDELVLGEVDPAR